MLLGLQGLLSQTLESRSKGQPLGSGVRLSAGSLPGPQALPPRPSGSAGFSSAVSGGRKHWPEVGDREIA